MHTSPFVFSSAEETIIARGIHRYVSDTRRDSLPERIAAFFASSSDPTPPRILVGALPYDRGRAPFLFQPAECQRYAGDPLADLLTANDPQLVQWTVSPQPSRAEYERNVAHALAEMETQGTLRKVVLARTLLLRANTSINPYDIVARLRSDPNVTAFCVPLPATDGNAERVLVGATPELLLEKRGATITSLPLAGSAPRYPDPAADEEASASLLQSDKDLREHAAVVEWVADKLAPYCTELDVPRTPSLHSTRTLWHLGTRITGTLRDASMASVALADLLHPTPAVCGLPYERACTTIKALESFDREFFAGAVGWCDANGDGQWMVSIRCAELCGNTARLYAGAGIVAGSDPVAEGAETSAKFTALLRALGVDEHGQPLSEAGV